VKKLFSGRSLSTRHVVTAVVLLGLLALVLSGCTTDTPQNTFDSRGEPGRMQRTIFYLAMWPAIVIMVGVLLACVIAVVRFRRKSEDEPPPKQVHGNTRLEVAWTIAPAILLLILAVPMVATIAEVDRSPADDAFPVRVTGFQFAWQFEYLELEDQAGNPVTTLGTVHVPVDREVGFYITATDVIHSFWFPKMGGKLDAIPGRENVMWIRADEPGSFSGQCAEFCGLGHADMTMTMIAHDDDDFAAWVEQVTGAGAPPDDEAPEEDETEDAVLSGGTSGG
jgi:cytochrome c oxidase subunit II